MTELLASSIDNKRSKVSTDGHRLNLALILGSNAGLSRDRN